MLTYTTEAVEWVSEWVSECCLTPTNFSDISWREPVNFQWDEYEFHFVLDQHAEFDFYSASSLKQQSMDRYVAPLGHIILIQSHLCSICSFSFLLHA